MIKVTVNEIVLNMSNETTLKQALTNCKKVVKFKNSDLKDIDSLIYNTNKNNQLSSILAESRYKYNGELRLDPKDITITFEQF